MKLIHCSIETAILYPTPRKEAQEILKNPTHEMYEEVHKSIGEAYTDAVENPWKNRPVNWNLVETFHGLDLEGPEGKVTDAIWGICFHMPSGCHSKWYYNHKEIFESDLNLLNSTALSVSDLGEEDDGYKF